MTKAAIAERLVGRPCIGHVDKRWANGSTQVAIRFTDRQFQAIVTRADESGRSVAAVVRELIDRALAR